MSSNGLVSLSGVSAILQVHAFENGILAVPLFDAQHSFLELPLSGMGGFVGLLLLLLGGIVGEKINCSVSFLLGTSASGSSLLALMLSRRTNRFLLTIRS